MKKTLIALAFAAIVAPIAAQATQSNGIDYTYLQLDYVNITQAGNTGVAQGGMLTGSYGFHDNFQMFGSYSALNFNKVSDYDPIIGHFSWTPKVKPWSIGMGYAFSIGSRADWVTQAAYQHDKNSNHMCLNDYCVRFNGSNNFWTVNTGVMGRVTDKLTANAYLGYDHGVSTHGDGNLFGQFGLVYNFTPMWAVEGGVRVSNNSNDIFNVGIRASF
ncbi:MULTISPECIES: autotransporter outer membrane beta-barrel domain-containing protein [unclassified Dyella]|uniref:autotransporter outer membrane beta-barrel domain-containing protein n=1 Tax=unclassified Dyella TaxID=2634549 RepID=UPI000C81DBFA|nr:MULTISPECIES: autotransporter outer membrane beta-barrel domain-containing protein [unclassified Dyella]MDR3444557.1 autotransporter outer membrane beta-barrel domain-containing protein [Dyella sp.]PMQ05615.1 hypothetical protein DyAD56_09800 [Dyella sp. AD56]